MSRVAGALESEATPERPWQVRPIVVGPESPSLEAAWLSTVFVEGPTRPERLRRALATIVAPHRLDEAVRHLEWACDPMGQWGEKERRAALRTAHNFMRFDAARTPTLVVIDASQLTGRRADALNAAFAALEDAPVRVLLAHDGPLIDVLEPVVAAVSVAPLPSGTQGSADRTRPPAEPAGPFGGDAASDSRPRRRLDEATRAVRVSAGPVAPTAETARHDVASGSPPQEAPDVESRSPEFVLQSETRETTERSSPPLDVPSADATWAAVVWATGGVSWPRLIDEVTGWAGSSASLVASGALERRAPHMLAGEAAVALAGYDGSAPPRPTTPSIHTAVATFIGSREPVDAGQWLAELERQWRWAGDDARASAAAAARALLPS